MRRMFAALFTLISQGYARIPYCWVWINRLFESLGFVLCFVSLVDHAIHGISFHLSMFVDYIPTPMCGEPHTLC